MIEEALSLARSRCLDDKVMVEQLHQWCAINSGTSNLAGLATMHQTLHDAFLPIADVIESHTLPAAPSINLLGLTESQPCGDLLFIRKRPHLKRRILLTGHMDTVFDKHHPFQTLRQLNHNTLNGPGAADMKGGLAVMLHALQTFEQSSLAPTLGWDVVINADEEIGSPASRLFLDNMAANYPAALVYEPAMDASGTFARKRKGSGKLTLIATGKSAHAGRAFQEGRNAICYLAEAVVAVHALNNQRCGVTLNVGKMAGGEALNVVPPLAAAQIDVRISKASDEPWVRKQIQRIIHSLQRPDYTLTLHGTFGRPVKPISLATKRMFSRLQGLGKLLNLKLDWQDSGGCCDGNNLAHHGLAVIDTLGVRGGAIHCSDEYILLDSLNERATLSALLLLDLADGGLEAISAQPSHAL
jgi:glutamate carboxypeptidase